MPLIDFLNDAIGIAGYDEINDIDESTTVAIRCKRFHDKLRRAALSLSDWSFASYRATLVANATAPTFEWAYAYDTDPDMLVIREYNGNLITPSAVDPDWWKTWSGRYRIEQTFLLSNEGEVKIRYTRDVVNPEQWSPLFYQMLATWMASKLASAVGRDTNKATALLGQAINLGLPLAAGVDGQQGTVTPYVVDDLFWGR